DEIGPCGVPCVCAACQAGGQGEGTERNEHGVPSPYRRRPVARQLSSGGLPRTGSTIKSVGAANSAWWSVRCAEFAVPVVSTGGVGKFKEMARVADRKERPRVAL